jgi:TRAP transporter TAXI family solute receptor
MNAFFTRLGATALVGTALAAAPVAAQGQEFINVLTGGTSGVYYPLGVALSEIYAEGIEGSRTQVQATKASVENLNLLAQGRGEIAFALGDSVALASPARWKACGPSAPSIPITSRSSPMRSRAS